jgi:hypothetical protein
MLACSQNSRLFYLPFKFQRQNLCAPAYHKCQKLKGTFQMVFVQIGGFL